MIATAARIAQAAPRSRRAWAPNADDHQIYRWVRFDGKSQVWAANQFGISQATVSRVIQCQKSEPAPDARGEVMQVVHNLHNDCDGKTVTTNESETSCDESRQPAKYCAGGCIAPADEPETGQASPLRNRRRRADILEIA